MQLFLQYAVSALCAPDRSKSNWADLRTSSWDTWPPVKHSCVVQTSLIKFDFWYVSYLDMLDPPRVSNVRPLEDSGMIIIFIPEEYWGGAFDSCFTAFQCLRSVHYVHQDHWGTLYSPTYSDRGKPEIHLGCARPRLWHKTSDTIKGFWNQYQSQNWSTRECSFPGVSSTRWSAETY